MYLFYVLCTDHSSPAMNSNIFSIFLICSLLLLLVSAQLEIITKLHNPKNVPLHKDGSHDGIWLKCRTFSCGRGR
ncbi:hypothetical protein L596_030382 [Steinernema carpocapsae]|uniref:Uncharacterized protein n=1 Tax=Steinernema carpocapsae TaxID=34508 RepID=A0A4U5LP76_STECR|nr:hypothetical protein L596_030382 [Steinernema carpocapsae]